MNIPQKMRTQLKINKKTNNNTKLPVGIYQINYFYYIFIQIRARHYSSEIKLSQSLMRNNKSFSLFLIDTHTHVKMTDIQF